MCIRVHKGCGRPYYSLHYVCHQALYLFFLVIWQHQAAGRRTAVQQRYQQHVTILRVSTNDMSGRRKVFKRSNNCSAAAPPASHEVCICVITSRRDVLCYVKSCAGHLHKSCGVGPSLWRCRCLLRSHRVHDAIMSMTPSWPSWLGRWLLTSPCIPTPYSSLRPAAAAVPAALPLLPIGTIVDLGVGLGVGFGPPPEAAAALHAAAEPPPLPPPAAAAANDHI